MDGINCIRKASRIWHSVCFENGTEVNVTKSVNFLMLFQLVLRSESFVLNTYLKMLGNFRKIKVLKGKKKKSLSLGPRFSKDLK